MEQCVLNASAPWQTEAVRASRFVRKKCCKHYQGGKPFTDCSTVEQNSLNVAGIRRATDCHHCHVKRVKCVSSLHSSFCQWFEEQFLKNNSKNGTLQKSFKQTVSADLSRRFHMGLGADISAVAVCLDPRHKSLKFLNEIFRLRIHEHVRSFVDDIEERSKINTDTETEPSPKISAMAFLLREDYLISSSLSMRSLPST